MGILVGALKVIFCINCVLMVILILLQSSEGAGIAGTFGGGETDTALGSRSASTLTKATGVMAGIFLLLCVVLAVIGNIEKEAAVPPQQAGADEASRVPPGAETDVKKDEAPAGQEKTEDAKDAEGENKATADDTAGEAAKPAEEAKASSDTKAEPTKDDATKD